MKLITEEEVGECRVAIRAVALEGKPIVEVSCRPGVEADLREDIEECRRNSGHGDAVLCWIRPYEGMLRYGFYGEAWTIAALDWLDAADLEPTTRKWIGGLLYGYTPAAIQAFIGREGRQPQALPGDCRPTHTRTGKKIHLVKARGIFTLCGQDLGPKAGTERVTCRLCLNIGRRR